MSVDARKYILGVIKNTYCYVPLDYAKDKNDKFVFTFSFFLLSFFVSIETKG